MLTRKLIEDALFKLGFEDIDITVEEDNGDYIKAFSNDLDFDRVKSALIKTKPFMSNIKDIGPTRVFLILPDVWKGYNFSYFFTFEAREAYGITYKLGTKRIDYYEDGFYKPFISFEMMSNYMRTFSKVD